MEKVSEEQRFKCLETRNLNQDALENTFGPTCAVGQMIIHL